MATTLPFILGPEDEKKLFEFLVQFDLTLYPERIPPGWKAPKVAPAALPELDEPAYYLAAEAMGPLEIRTVKRGKGLGLMQIDETNSPVMHYERSVLDEEGVLRSGRLWTYLDVTGDARRTPSFPELYRRMWLQIREQMLKWHRSQPAGWIVGPQAARLHKAGTVLRESGHKGIVIRPYK